jgi:hypothetical protein
MSAAIVTLYCDPRYGITRDGRVFRLERPEPNGPKSISYPREIKLRADKDGYLMAGRSWKVHRLVATQFIPNPFGHKWVAHNDGNPKNNHVSNLRWDTAAANHADKRRHNTMLCGTQHPMHKLTEADVKAARRRANSGETHSSIAEDFVVDRSVLSRAIRGATWAHV